MSSTTITEHRISLESPGIPERSCGAQTLRGNGEPGPRFKSYQFSARVLGLQQTKVGNESSESKNPGTGRLVNNGHRVTGQLARVMGRRLGLCLKL